MQRCDGKKNPQKQMRKDRKSPQSDGIYLCQVAPFSGRKYAEIMPQARRMFRAIQKMTKRRPYLRCAYFKKDKIFFEYFWTHLNQKLTHDRARRLKYFPCALELLHVSKHPPVTFVNADLPGVIHHRFIGITRDHTRFAVIVRQDRSSGKKYLLSLFPFI